MLQWFFKPHQLIPKTTSRLGFFDFLKSFYLSINNSITFHGLSQRPKKDKVLLENNVNFPELLDPERAVYVEHWNAYPPLDSVTANYIIINKSALKYLSSKESKASYQRFYTVLINSPSWAMIHSEKAIPGQTMGPEIVVYKLKVDD